MFWKNEPKMLITYCEHWLSLFRREKKIKEFHVGILEGEFENKIKALVKG